MTKFIRALVIALAFLVPSAAMAQTVPSYATPIASANDDSQIRGRVVAFNGKYQLTVRDGKGYVDNVELHEGTIINPTGLTLEPGMIVSVLGYNAGPYFEANEIDTPYTYYAGVPYFLGHPWNYYGPTISLGFFFGHTGWWHGAAFHGAYHFDHGARVYSDVHIRNMYHGGGFHGRSYVASAAHGGYHAGATHVGGIHGGGFHGGGMHGGGFHGGGGHGGGGHH